MNSKTKAKKKVNNAELKAALVIKKPLYLKRLEHDLNEIKNQKIPIPGVSAAPISEDFYEWHGNIKCLRDNVYKGAVLHLKFHFNIDYPISPPDVYVLNRNIVHPNIIENGKICLDILERKKNEYIGWRSGYTVLTILSQLQNFFFDVNKTFLISDVEEKKELEIIEKKELEEKRQEEKEEKERKGGKKEEKEKEEKKEEKKERKKKTVYVPFLVKEQLQQWSDYTCEVCKSHGNTDPFPKFPEKEKLNNQLTEEEYKEAKKQEICCFLNKELFEKTQLGLGINISTVLRTGEIKSVDPSFDFISFKAFSKDRIRYTFDKKRFTYFFPLYFGEKDKEKIEKFKLRLTKTLSLIVKGNTKEFQPDLILKVMTKLFNSCCLNIINEKIHNSTRAIEILIYIFRVLIFLVNTYPEIKKEINTKIENFIKIPEERVKSKTPSLGDLLIMLYLSDHKIEELLSAYISEKMDRQILWILNTIPELEELIDKKEIDDVRAKICFKAGIISEQFLLFHHYFSTKIVYKECENLDKFAEKLDQNYGCLTEVEIDKHRVEINKLLKIDNYKDYYEFMGMKSPSEEELNDQLKQAFKNSKEKKYHGFDETRFVPGPEEQVKFYMKKYEPLDKLFENEKSLNEEEQNWEELLNHFDIVKQYKYSFPKKKLTAIDLIEFYREKMREKLLFEVSFNKKENISSSNKEKIPLFSFNNGRGRGGNMNNRGGNMNNRGRNMNNRGGNMNNRGGNMNNRGGFMNNRGGNMNNRGRSLDNRRRGRSFLKNQRRNKSADREVQYNKSNNIIKPSDNLEIELKVNKRKYVKKYEDEEILEKFNLKQLFLKLYLEEFCKYFNYIGNFKKLYKILDLVKDEITHFSFVISNNGILKSDYNFVRGILSRLTSLKYLELVFTSDINIKLLKNLVKGISNNLKGKGAIEHFKLIINPNIFNKYSTKELNVLTILDNMPSLKMLDVSGVTLDMNLIQRIKNHLYYYKKLKVLNISHCNLNDQMCNELADGIMKAKALEKLDISGNITSKGISNIIYNLAFQPSVKILDISHNDSCDKNETATALYKFIKMSQSVEVVIANNISNFNKSLTQDFFKTLGDNNYLSYLDLSNNGEFVDINQLGKAIGFNALKNGSLSYLDISKCIKDYNNLTNFFKSMCISEADHNEWYGFQFNSNIAKETPDYYKKILYCNLQSLIIKGAESLKCYTNYLLPINANLENPIKMFINQSKKLDTLVLDNSIVNEHFITCISEAIRCQNNIEYLSLSNCSINSYVLKSLLPCFYESSEREIKIAKKVKIKKKQKGKKVKKYNANPNFHIKGLNLSCNNIYYSAVNSLCQAMEINKTINYLNLFHNSLGVSGAERIGNMIKINNNLIELDIGYNRIKDKGFASVINAIIENKDSSLKKLGVNYNFIRDKQLAKQFEKIGKCDKLSLEEIILRNNLFTSKFLPNFYGENYKKCNKNIATDIFDVLYYLEPERIERTVWIGKGDSDNQASIYNALYNLERTVISEEESHIGMVLSIRTIRGRRTGQKKQNVGTNAFIEFIMPNSVNRMLKTGNTYKFYLSGKERKVYKAGTRLNYIVVKKKIYN